MIGLVEAERHQGEQITCERRYYISSLTHQSVDEFARAVRSHWGIDNSLHWILDIAFREDESRVRKDHALENMAVLRHMALNLSKKQKTRKRGTKTNLR